MPYIHWELEDARKQMSCVIKDLITSNEEGPDNLLKQFSREYFIELLKKNDKKERRSTKHLVEHGLETTEPHFLLLEKFLFYDPPLHIRRTLDQFYYYMEEDTDVRDSDQVISRYSRRKFPRNPVPIVMVDQLWLWVVNNSKSIHLNLNLSEVTEIP
jgi:hypothetical protein